MRYKKILLILLTGMIFTGCSKDTESSSPLPDLDSIIEQENSSAPESETEAETEAFSENIYYLTSHQTDDSANLTKFRSHLETDGFVWNECGISEIPADADILIYNFPKEDLSSEEYQLLKEYADRGGDILLFLPASDSEVRYKFLNLFLESFSIQIDYDNITIPEQDADWVVLQTIEMPDRMTAYDDSMQTTPVYMQKIRSFHMLGNYATDELFIDVMLQTPEFVIGEPFGGTEDDPVTYENEKLDILLYSRDAIRNNASVIACGANDFLLDENFDSDISKGAQNWIYSSLFWFCNYDAYQ